MRLGVPPKGLIASGHVTRSSFEARHWEFDRRTARDKALFVEVDFDHIATSPVILAEELDVEPFSVMNWTPQASGTRISPEVQDVLELVWSRRTGIGPSRTADESVAELMLVEGAVRSVVVNAFERNAEARRQCIAHYGAKCFVCDLSFEETYGDFARDYIHVHHIVPVSSIAKDYVIDPVAHLRPLCPNCHAAIHLTRPLTSPERLREMLRERRPLKRRTARG